MALGEGGGGERLLVDFVFQKQHLKEQGGQEGGAVLTQNPLTLNKREK